MAESRAAYRYALALLEVAEEQKQLDAVARDFDLLERLLRENRDFSVFLKSPVINKLKKKETFTVILSGKVSELVMRFIHLLASKERVPLLPDIMTEFSRLRDVRLGIVNVTASTFVQLHENQIRELVRRIEQSTNKKVRLNTVLDPSLKGGFRIRFNDTVWDGSVRRQLELLKQRLLSGEAIS